MRVCFLDIDGVLNSTQFFHLHQKREAEIWEDLDPESVCNLDVLLNEAPDLKVVVSSSWRNQFRLPEIVSFLTNRGLRNTDRFIDVTPYYTKALENLPHLREKYRRSAPRGVEILSWLKSRPKVTAFVVLDDDSDMDYVEGHFVKVDRKYGLLKSHVREALVVLHQPISLTPPIEDPPGVGPCLGGSSNPLE